MYKTSRKVKYAFSRKARDIINSRRVNRRVNQQRQLSLKQNELDMEQLYLIENLSNDMIEEGTGEYFLVGKYLEMCFGNPATKENIELSEQDIKEIDSRIPEGEMKTRFKQYGINPALRKILYYTLIIAIITALVVPVEGYCGSKEKSRKRDRCYHKYGKNSKKCQKLKC